MDVVIAAILSWLSTLHPVSVAWALGAVAVAVLLIWKGWPAFRKFVGILSRVVKLVDTLTDLPDDLAAIRHELEHNGGGSVKDAVARTEQAIADMRGDVADVRGDVGHVRRQVASLKTSLAKTNRRLDTNLTERSES